MKYRRLNNAELVEVEKEFINFLVSNSVTGEDWVKIKAETPDRAEKLIELFSDIVFDKVLTKVEYLEFKKPKDIKIFHCLPDKIKLLGLLIEGDSALDFSQNLSPAQMMELLKNSDAQLKLYSADKAYSKDREMELFEMMESGCLISKGELFKTLEELK
jgi:uncharacterized protein DUF6495